VRHSFNIQRYILYGARLSVDVAGSEDQLAEQTIDVIIIILNCIANCVQLVQK
jgi:hypothetical protein